MRQFLRIIAGIICFASIILAGCEEADGSCNIAWTLGWMFSAVAWGFILKKTEESE